MVASYWVSAEVPAILEPVGLQVPLSELVAEMEEVVDAGRLAGLPLEQRLATAAVSITFALLHCHSALEWAGERPDLVEVAEAAEERSAFAVVAAEPAWLSLATILRL